MTAARLVDLSHAVEAGLVTYPGLPAPVVTEFLSREASAAHYAPGTSFHIARIEMVANTGTYLDAPFHRYADGADLAALALARLADLDGVVVDATGQVGRGVDEDVFAGLELGGRAVLVHTGWAVHWGTPRYFDGHPFLTRHAVERLVRAGPALVGIDSLNVDDTADPERPAYSGLLAAGSRWWSTSVTSSGCRRADSASTRSR